jgi:antitoxin component HigA of HigAB toxin-antitoxin module
MKATLIVIQNDSEHAEAKALVEKLMGSSDPGELARMTAQAGLVEAYERPRWPRCAPSLPNLLRYLMDQHGLTRADLVPLLGTASRVGLTASDFANLYFSIPSSVCSGVICAGVLIRSISWRLGCFDVTNCSMSGIREGSALRLKSIRPDRELAESGTYEKQADPQVTTSVSVACDRMQLIKEHQERVRAKKKSSIPLGGR